MPSLAMASFGVLWRLLCDSTYDKPYSPTQFTHLLVLMFEESTSLLIQPYKIHKFLCGSCFFFHFHCTLFHRLNCRSFHEPWKFFKLSFSTCTYLSHNSLNSSWISAKFVSALFPCMLYLSYYFQPEVNT